MKAILGFKALFTLITFSFLTSVSAQTHTPRYVSLIPNSNGYYEYLPLGYSATAPTLYPVLIFIHGMGELGNGGTGAGGLSAVLRNGPPKEIQEGDFPVTFTVNTQQHRFIVISPQFINWPGPLEIEALINELLLRYKINPNRVYLTGLSMGGGVTWEYAGHNPIFPKRLAAIVPVCGASWPENYRARMIANNNLPVWATHNTGDPTVPLWYTESYIDQINTAPAPTPLAKKSIWVSNSHDAWSRTYNPANKEFGDNANLNIYEWMLQYQRNIAQIPLPVLLSNYTASLTSANTVKIDWTTTFEANNAFFTIERSTDGVNFSVLTQVTATNNPSGSSYSYIDQNPAAGDNYYRLSQSDIDGKTTTYTIHKVRVGNIGANTVVVFPNPVRDNLSVRITNTYTGELNIRVINSSGSVSRNIKVGKVGASLQQSFSIAELPSGYYTLEIKGNNYSYSTPFIKQ